HTYVRTLLFLFNHTAPTHLYPLSLHDALPISVSGTPASIRAIEAPHTVAIDDEPFDSRISETTRTVYGKASRVGRTASMARWSRAPWPISRRPGVPKRLTSPVENDGKL